MTANDHIRGHEIYYDDDDKCWKYVETNKRVYDNTIENCVKCNKPPIDDIDFCLYGLKDADLIEAACCGHGVEKGYILLKDGRRFEEVEHD